MIQALTLRDLALSRGGRRLFSGLNLSLVAGQACALTGANGSGKTTLLRAVAGLVCPDAGEVGFGAADAAAARAGDLHFAGHQDGLKPARTVAEELDFWIRWCGAAPADAARAIEALDLSRLLTLEVRRLSAGQRRRLAFSRLVSAPRTLWLLDEPLSPLDAMWRERMAVLMTDHLAGGGMIVAAVHDPLPIAALNLEIGA